MTANDISKNTPDKSGRSQNPRVNEQITAPLLRLINEQGIMIGVVSRSVALKAARDALLDLVEISPHTDPPVCKVLNYGKFKYEAQKKRAEIKKKQIITEIKEIQIRPTIEENDYRVKREKALCFLQKGNKVKVTLQFRGREVNHQQFGLNVLKRLEDDLADIAKIELSPKLEGRRMIIVLGPK